MRRALVVANWKMHGRVAALDDYVAGLQWPEEVAGGVEVVVCPPVPYLSALRAKLANSGIALGAQDCAAHVKDGAFTGEVSAAMLADVGCRWVIVGHSERRQAQGETDTVVAAKFLAAQAAELSPILCVGETTAEREEGRAYSTVLAQLESVLERIGLENLGRAALAYEPVWAIGSGKPARPADAEAMHRILRAAVAKRSRMAAQSLRILYGGSVKAENAEEFFAEPDIDGALIGGASLDAGLFSKIVVATQHMSGDQLSPE
ncbi:MAG: triose-phosphate isomerase [Gammaproteobacteria bacterium]